MASPSIFNKNKLSGSTDGKSVNITATSSPGTTVHTAVAGTTANTWDEIWIWAHNYDTAAHKLTVEFGGTTSPNDTIEVTIPPASLLSFVVPGLILDNGSVVKAFASTTNTIALYGFVNEVRP